MNKPRLLEVGGKSHRLLRHLASGHADMAALWEAEGVTHRQGPRRKLFYIMITLRDLGFVTHRAERFTLTSTGEAALARLNAGEALRFGEPRPNARVFNRSAA